MSLKFGEVHLGLSATPRDVRRLVAAVAIGRGDPVPVNAVPHDYLPLLKAVYVARTNGQSWSEALAEVGLELPDDEQMFERIDGMREELRSAWPRVQFVLGALQRSGNPVAVSQTRERIKQFLV